MKKEDKQNLKRLYEKLDAIENRHLETLSDDVKALRKMEDKYKYWKSFQAGTVGYTKAYRELLLCCYDYYLLTGELFDKYTPEGVTVPYLVEWFNREHKIAFNLGVQQRVHIFLMSIVHTLKALETIDPKVVSTELGMCVKGFEDQCKFIVEHGFALDIEFYKHYIEPKWVVLEMSRSLTVEQFRPLVEVLDKYSRLRTGKELKVVFTPDESHIKKSKDEGPSEADLKRQEYEREKAKSRLSLNDDGDKIVVTLPEQGKRNNGGKH